MTIAIGERTAYADDNHPRVEAAGWYFSTQYPPDANGNSVEIKFGVTGKCDAGTNCPGGVTGPKGRFEYFNTFTGLRVHGKINNMHFHPSDCGPNAPPIAPIGAPAVLVSGQCDDPGETCSFSMDLVDGGKHNDFVCNVMVSGETKNHLTAPLDTEPAQQLFKGEINIRNYQP